MKKPWTDRFTDFMAGRGFYIVLFLCVAAIGASGYYLFSSLGGRDEDRTVSGPAQIVASPPVVLPSASPSMSLSPSPSPTPVKPAPSPPAKAKPSATPAPAASSAPSSVAPSAKTRPAPTVFTWPVNGRVVDAFSPDHQRYDVTMADWRTHEGIDISAEIGTPVKAAASGTVLAVMEDDLLGTTVTIDHGEDLKSVYANLGATPTVAEGDSVTAGDVIGAVGATAKGESSQVSHLHFGFFKNDLPADPASYLPSSS